MPSELVNDISSQIDYASRLWDQTSPEIKTIFKKHYDAHITNDKLKLISEGFPQLYAEMELGKKITSTLEAGSTPSISPDGNIDSDGKYEKYDLGWIEAGIIFLKNLLEDKYSDLTLPAQVSGYQPLVIPNDATLALIGDWGTGDWQGDKTPAAEVAVVVSNTIQPEVVVHVGDVYYYGSEDQYQDNFVNLLPKGSLANVNLNSNHDMYSVSEPYFNAISQAPFGSQGNTSYFAMTNNNWLIVMLDTAYLASWEDAFLYGSLGNLDSLSHDLIANEQTKFLSSMVQQAVTDKKQLIIMSHHTGFIGAGMNTAAPVLPFSKKTLWQQVTTLLQPYLKNNKAYWYWGHAHSGYTLNEIDGIHARCVGHGAVPWGKGSDFFTGTGSNIEWFESTPMPNTSPLTVNGLMSVVLNDATITEQYYTQDGTPTYKAVNGVKTTE